MKLQYYCSSPSCGKSNTIRVKSNNRFDLKAEIGEELNKRCKHCGHQTKRHINRLMAEPNYYLIIGGIIAAVLITVFIWDLGFVSTLTGSIPIAVWMSEKKKASNFNRVMV